MARFKHKPESGGSRRNYFLMDGSDGIELRKVFVSSVHGWEKNRKSSTPMQAERSPSRRNSRERLDFPRNPDRCGVLPVSEPEFGPANLHGRNFPITHHSFSEQYAVWICFQIGLPHIDRMIPLQANRFSFCGIGKSLPNKIRSHADGFPKRKIPGVKQKNIPF